MGIVQHLICIGISQHVRCIGFGIGQHVHWIGIIQNCALIHQFHLCCCPWCPFQGVCIKPAATSVDDVQISFLSGWFRASTSPNSNCLHVGDLFSCASSNGSKMIQTCAWIVFNLTDSNFHCKDQSNSHWLIFSLVTTMFRLRLMRVCFVGAKVQVEVFSGACEPGPSCIGLGFSNWQTWSMWTITL